jgi:hypothetical protein
MDDATIDREYAYESRWQRRSMKHTALNERQRTRAGKLLVWQCPVKLSAHRWLIVGHRLNEAGMLAAS